jgi:nucleoside 2-deoxyribosyltransferase
MNLYFSCSLTGGRDDQPVYAALVDYLLAQGHTVPTAHLAHPEVMREEAAIDPVTVYRRDIRWLDECEAMIAEVSTPSHGVGYEIACALGAGKPVLCLHRRNARVSKMITGNTAPRLRVREYEDEREALNAIEAFVRDAVQKSKE